MRRAASPATTARVAGIPAADAAGRVEAGEPHVWRVAVPEDRGDIVFDDAIRGEVRFPGDAMDDFILVRTDGSPTYNFATVVDDWMMEMTHIIRGDDHLSNTPRQIVVFEALEAPVPVFAHMSLIFGADGKRLSKRHGATSVESYRDEGILSEALLNYLALLGWSIDDKTTLFDRETLVREFDLGSVSSSPGVWDPEKLEWMNGLYIRELTPDELVERMLPWLEEAGLMTAEEASDRGASRLAAAPRAARIGATEAAGRSGADGALPVRRRGRDRSGRRREGPCQGGCRSSARRGCRRDSGCEAVRGRGYRDSSARVARAPRHEAEDGLSGDPSRS